MRIFVSLLSGLIFGIGLVISGMANPAKVQNFLDVFGSWDPSLAFVMGGAILVAAPAFFIARRAEARPVMAEAFNLPTNQTIDRQLLVGAGLFGIGWGMVGLCPGPALVGVTGSFSAFILFVVVMLAGIIISKLGVLKLS